jgi:hypothetical protein
MEIIECAICYEEIGETNKCVTPCGHDFCFKCMVKSFQMNETCPMCRTSYLEKDECLHSDSEDEESDDDSDDETLYDDDEYVSPDQYLQELDNVTQYATIAKPKTVADQLEKKGYTMEDVLSLYMGRIDRTDSKYTQSYVRHLKKNLDTIVTESDQEQERALMENYMMRDEDIRSDQLIDADVFDMNPGLELHSLFN